MSTNVTNMSQLDLMLEMNSVKDMINQPLNVGDYVVYQKTYGPANVPGNKIMHIGKIIKFELENQTVKAIIADCEHYKKNRIYKRDKFAWRVPYKLLKYHYIDPDSAYGYPWEFNIDADTNNDNDLTI